MRRIWFTHTQSRCDDKDKSILHADKHTLRGDPVVYAVNICAKMTCRVALESGWSASQRGKSSPVASALRCVCTKRRRSSLTRQWIFCCCSKRAGADHNRERHIIATFVSAYIFFAASMRASVRSFIKTEPFSRRQIIPPIYI